MEKIIIEYEVGNAEFQTDEQISEGIQKGIKNYFNFNYKTIRDCNGNVVGKISSN